MDTPHPDNPRKSGPPAGAQAQSVSTLRKLWQQAVADESEGLDPNPVLDRLESKYDGLSKASGR